MLLELLQRPSLFELLARIDEELAEQHRLKGCPHCGGPLHRADYRRSPRGFLGSLPEEYAFRHSFCCGRDGCRHRSLPPSCLFWERRGYWGVVMWVVVALRQQRPGGSLARKLQELLGVSRATVSRWMVYFRRSFPRSCVWQRIRGLVPAEVRNNDLPGGLLKLFLEQGSDPEAAIVGCLRLLARGASPP